MNRSLHHMLVATVAALLLLAPANVWAGTLYTVHWAFTEENPVCESAELGAQDGNAFFHVNDTPLPTNESPGALVNEADGSQRNTAEAPFDSVLLRTGTNDFLFAVANTLGNDACVHSHNVVSLVSPTLGINKPLFDVRRDGTVFIGDAQVDLSLTEINPPLARDIANLEAAIAAQRKEIIANAAKTAQLAEKLSKLQALGTELEDLAKRPLDEIDQADLDDILNRYADVIDDDVKAVLSQLITDLKKSITDLENELASLIDNFGAQADAAANLATQGAGWNPDDPSNYGLGPGTVPWVDVPDLSNVPGAFTPGNDPYDAYADAVITALAGDVNGAQVSLRPDFVANVRAWRANEAALQQALVMRPNVSLAEINAFLNGQNKVTGYVQKFMDTSDWFLDSPVPADVRADVDGVLKNDFGPLADEMKDGLNLWGPLDQGLTQLSQTIDAFANAVSVIGNGFAAYGDLMVTLVHASERVAIGFVPYVGPALDLCEAVTGKEWCLPGGNELSTEQRIFSATGVAVSGVAKFWGGAKNAAISPAAKLVAEDVSLFGEDLAPLMRANRKTFYKTLRGAITTKPMNDFERKAAKSLLDEGHALIGVGDDGVRTVLKMDPGDPACDFLSVNKGNKLVLGEAKAIEDAASKTAGVDADHAVKQLTSTMEKLKKTGLAGDVDRLELRMPKGAPFKNKDLGIKDGYLIKWSTGKPVEIKDFPLLFIKVVQL